MSEFKDLFTGPAVVIDDEIFSEDSPDSIKELVQEIENEGIPCVKYESIPNEDKDVHEHLSGISFLILDWKLYKGDASAVEEDNKQSNVKFINKLLEKTFIPIFIFTSEGVDDIVKKLKKENIDANNQNSLIFVKPKLDLINGNLFSVIAEWIKANPSAYVLKEWEKEYEKAKSTLFREFMGLSPYWPCVLWNTFQEDQADSSLGIGEVITRNLHSRMMPFEFKEEILDLSESGDKDDIRRVLSGEKFIANNSSSLNSNFVQCGDVFYYKPKGVKNKHYYINIRPDCDCINRKGNVDDTVIYLLRMSKLSINKEQGCFMQGTGNFREIDVSNFIFCMYEDRSFLVTFKDLLIDKYGNAKNDRVGRLLPPYITRIQQRYSLYLQRQGLPRTPAQAVIEENNQNGDQGSKG